MRGSVYVFVHYFWKISRCWLQIQDFLVIAYPYFSFVCDRNDGHLCLVLPFIIIHKYHKRQYGVVLGKPHKAELHNHPHYWGWPVPGSITSCSFSWHHHSPNFWLDGIIWSSALSKLQSLEFQAGWICITLLLLSWRRSQVTCFGSVERCVFESNSFPGFQRGRSEETAAPLLHLGKVCASMN